MSIACDAPSPPRRTCTPPAGQGDVEPVAPDRARRRARSARRSARRASRAARTAPSASRTTPSALPSDRLTTTRCVASGDVHVQATRCSHERLSGQPSTSTSAHSPRRMPSPMRRQQPAYQLASSASGGSSGRRPSVTGTRTRRPSACPSCSRATPGSVSATTAAARSSGRRQHGRQPRLVVVLDEAHGVRLVAGVGAEVVADRAGRLAVRRGGRTGACRSRRRSPARRAPARGPSTPRPRTRSRGAPPARRRSPSASSRARRRATDRRAARSPHVRTNTSSSTSIAMSQRTPSHRSAIDATTSAAACRTAGSEASSCSTSGHGGKYGSRPGDDASPTARNRRVARGRRRAAHEVLGVLVDPRVVGRDVVGDEVEDQPDAARRPARRGPRPGPASPPRCSSTR